MFILAFFVPASVLLSACLSLRFLLDTLPKHHNHDHIAHFRLSHLPPSLQILRRSNILYPIHRLGNQHIYRLRTLEQHQTRHPRHPTRLQLCRNPHQRLDIRIPIQLRILLIRHKRRLQIRPPLHNDKLHHRRYHLRDRRRNHHQHHPPPRPLRKSRGHQFHQRNERSRHRHKHIWHQIHGSDLRHQCRERGSIPHERQWCRWRRRQRGEHSEIHRVDETSASQALTQQARRSR